MHTVARRALAASVLLLPWNLAAQTPAGRDTAYVLPPLRVTASRSARPLLLQPLAITRLDRREFADQNGYGLDAALTMIPGVIAQSRYGTSDIRLVIRGFGARGAGDRSNAGTARGVRILLDGFPETEPDGRTSFDGIDLASAADIEVVRSNASSVWGNAAGGVVSISTIGEVEDPYASVEPAFGSFGLQRVAARSGTRLGGGGNLTGTVVNTDWDGWRAHSNSSRLLVNAAITSPIGQGTSLGVYLMASSHIFRIPGPLTQAQVDADPRQANATYASRDERRYNRIGRLGVRVEHALGGGSSLSSMLYVNPKYLQRSERGTFRDFTRYHLGGNVVYTLRSQLRENVGSRLEIGVDEAYQDGAILFYGLTADGNRAKDLRNNKREGANNVGVFVQEELSIGDRWSLNLGLRYDGISYYYDDYIDPSLDDQKSFQGVTPKVGVNYRITRSASIYASVGGGVEAPAGNETDPAGTFGQDTVTALNPLLDPIRSTTFEVGTKQISELGTALLTWNLALYTTGVRNEIVPYRGGRFYFTAGRVRRYGAELGARLTAGGFSTETALTLGRHQYSEYVVDSVHYGRAGHTADYSGNRVVGVPDVTYATNVSYAFRQLRDAKLQVGIQGMSSYYADDANAVTVDAFRTVSATVALGRGLPLGGGVGFHGFLTVNNLLDTKYIGSAFLNPDVVGGVPVAFEPGAPRSVTVGFSVGRLDR